MSNSEQAKASHLTALLQIIRRRTWTAVITALGIAIPAGIYALSMPPTYSAESEVMLQAGKQRVAEMKDVLVEEPLDEGRVLSEVEVLKSRNLAVKVIEHLDLLADPEFNEALRPRQGLAEPVKPTGSYDAMLDKATNVFFDHYKVKRKGLSFVVLISFFSKNPETAAKVVNAIADLYVNLTVQAKIEAAQKATVWLQQQVASLQAKVEDADRQMEDYRQRADLVLGDRAPLLAEEVSQANTQLLAATAARVEAEARFREMRTLIATNNIDSAIDVMASPLIQQLRAQEIALLGKKAELTTVYGERHSAMIQVNAELNDLQAKINAEIRKIVESYKNKVAIAQAQENVLSKRLEELKARIAEANKSEVKLNALDREAQSNRMILQSFLVRLKETSAQMDRSIQHPEAEVISKAVVPESPYLPKFLILFGLVAIATLSGVGVALGAEQLDRSLRSTEELDLGGSVRTLALVPRVRKGFRRTKPEAYVLNHHSSMFGESIRSIYSAIRPRKFIEGQNTVLFTSSHSGEGKTTVALCLGRLRSLAGTQCVLVEADLRKPSICSRLGIRHEAGLAEFLKGEVEICDVLVKDPASEMFVIPAGTTVFDPAEALASDRMRDLLDHLSKAFDLVLFDSPPVLAVSDALVLCNRIDAVVLIVQWGETNCTTVKLTLEKIAEAGSRRVGVVMSMVNPKKHAMSGFKDSGYFHHRTTRYYKNSSKAPFSGRRLEQSRGETHVTPPAASAEPLQAKNGQPEPLCAATAVEHASAEAPGERTGLSDTPIVGLPLIAPGRDLTADSCQGKLKVVLSRPFLRTTIAGAAVVVLALGTAVAWTLLRSEMDAPVEAGPAADASGPSPLTMAVARAPEPYSEPALAPAAAPTSPSVAATTKALAELTQKPTEAGVIPLPTEPTAPDQLAEKAMRDEQPAPALLLARGDELLAVSDIVSARLFFALAAAQGNAPAMTAMARTYDPLMLPIRNTRGVHPEPREAISWYRRAAAAGDATAEGRLHALADVLVQSGQIDASESAALLRVGEEGP